MTYTVVFNILIAGDMLGGHLDDMEVDWSKPIVSIRYAFFPLGLIVWVC